MTTKDFKFDSNTIKPSEHSSMVSALQLVIEQLTQQLQQQGEQLSQQAEALSKQSEKIDELLAEIRQQP
jgi:ABC-type transporter Mla subunit MlaD